MFHRLSGSSGSVLGFKFGDNVTGEDVHDMSGIVAAAIDASGEIRLLVVIEGFRHMEQDDLPEKLQFARDHAGDITRMAIVSDRVWIKSCVKVGGLRVQTEVEHFYSSEMEAAWEWVRK